MTREELELEAMRGLIALGLDPFEKPQWSRYDTVRIPLLGVGVYLECQDFRGKSFPEAITYLADHMETYMGDWIDDQSP